MKRFTHSHPNRGKTKYAHRAIPLSAESVRVLKWHKQNQIEEKAISAEG